MEQTTPERPVRPDTVDMTTPSNNSRTPRRSNRVKKTPSVTPNRFNKFFQPRPKVTKKNPVRTSRKALRDLTGPNLNSRLKSSQNAHDGPPTKKRKLSFTSISSLPSSPIKGHDQFPNSQEQPQPQTTRTTIYSQDQCLDTDDEDDLDMELDEDEDQLGLSTLPRTARYPGLSTSAAYLSRQLGRREILRHGNDSSLWQHETSHFYSLPNDKFVPPANNQREISLPFCVTSFNQQESVAIGNEDGLVEIFRAWSRMPDYDESLRHESAMFPHDNAIMDMEFSPDDHFLATASGDQTCRIIDMNTMTGAYTLVGHMGSLKRVQWQPGAGNTTLATCSRDGSIALWDLRCAQKAQGVLKVKPLVTSPHFLNNSREVSAKVEIPCAHTPWDKVKLGKRQIGTFSSKTDFAVTSCAFISESRPHLLASASEHNAIIKLWDMRASYKQKSGRPTPVSATVEPSGHESNRPYGVTSIVMNTDGSRLYTLCRDNTIYAYSTSHLVLGSCPEMSAASKSAFKQSRGAGTGLGPLYGFRHPSLRLGSFYDKLSLRPKTDEHTEILAAGTGEDCAVLFPTDERYLVKANRQPIRPDMNPALTASRSARSRLSRPLLPQRASSFTNNNRLSTSLQADDAAQDASQCPIYYHGTPLVNGHNKEVTAVAWVRGNGQLVTVADDYTARCWYEDDPNKARAIRMNAGRDEQRNRTGWAAVKAGFDDDEA